MGGCGTSPLARPPAGLRTTPRMCFPSPSLLTTGKLSLLQGTRPSSCGTPLLSAVHNPGGRSSRLGFLRQILSQQPEPNHRLGRVGQVCEGVEPDQLQAEDQPHWSYWLLEHCHYVP